MANTNDAKKKKKFWDSALALEPPDDCDSQSELSTVMASDGADGKFSSLGLGNSFAFKFEDLRGQDATLQSGVVRFQIRRRRLASEDKRHERR
ncbi:hypothetical protein ACFXTO_013347 [Malus domestica]